MVLRVVEDDRIVDLPIGAGEILLLPPQTCRTRRSVSRIGRHGHRTPAPPGGA